MKKKLCLNLVLVSLNPRKNNINSILDQVWLCTVNHIKIGLYAYIMLPDYGVSWEYDKSFLCLFNLNLCIGKPNISSTTALEGKLLIKLNCYCNYLNTKLRCTQLLLEDWFN